MLILVICFFGILVSLFRSYEYAVITSGSISKKLAYAYETDQNDRKQLQSFIPTLSELGQRDDQRLQQVKDIYEKGCIVKPLDKFHAAFIYHHSDNSEDYKTAWKLAAQAAKNDQLKDNYQVQWLKKAAGDRYRVSIGKPERYNTQNSFSIKIE